MKNDYLEKQIITYMGNKRKIISYISDIVDELEKKEGHSLTIGDGFSGSGIVSRLFKTKASSLYSNDLAGYSLTLNQCFLDNPTPKKIEEITKYIHLANEHVETKTLSDNDMFVSKHWSPQGTINENHRVYFTEENGRRIDLYRNFITTLPKKIQPFVLSQLLIQCSVHNNTNGQFSAFFKDKSAKIGKYGGENNIDYKRITAPISLEQPILVKHDCNVFISQNDTNQWCKKIPELDLIYYDPPYNKHPYNIYYFLLDIINNWDKSITVPNTNRGQPKDWKQSQYNSLKRAKETFIDLISNTKAKYILLSYNNGGIIPIEQMDAILEQFGEVSKIPINHKVYNRLKGLSNYKRKQEYKDVKEFLWLVQTTQ